MHADGTSGGVVQPSWILTAYGGIAMPLCLALVPIVNYLPAFYAQHLHLNVGLVGLVFLSARLWDGAADLLVGWLSDRSNSRFGRRKPWVILGAPILMVATWFLCNPSRDSGLAYLVTWAAIFYTAWTAMYIPYLSWGTELASDYVERNRVTSFREAFTMLGNLSFAASPLIFLSADAPLRDVLQLLAVVVLITVPLTAIPLGSLVPDSTPSSKTEVNLLRGMVVLVKDRVLIRFIIAALLIWTGEGVINSLIVFSFNVGLQLPNKFLWVIFIIYVATLTSLPLTLRIGKRVEKHWLLAGGIAIKACGFLAHLWVPMASFQIVAILWVIVGIAHAATLILPTSILADIIDNSELVAGERRSGAYVAVFNLAMKVGMALGVGLSFGLLALLHFDPNAASYQADDVFNIRMLAFCLPALLEALAIIFLLRHPITRNVQRQLRDAINARGTVSSAGVY